MCRLLVFKGTEPIQISHLVTKPAHSIINQAFDSRLRLDATRAVNGDGFGVGWYDAASTTEAQNEVSGAGQDAQQASEQARLPGAVNHHPTAPCIFTSVTPAWNNANLHRLADKIKSPLIFAHVRASTAGALSETNCHPWRYGRLMWMHNGQISSFSKIKRKVIGSLPEELFLFPQGHTDSEYAFCVFLSHLSDPLRLGPFSWRELRQAMLDTIADFNTWSREAGITEPSLMNFVVSDGESVVCSRYVNSKTDEAASLYFSSGTSFHEDSPGRYRMVKADKREKIILVASEPLTFEKADWIQIPTNTLVIITPKMNVLQQPIEDEFALPSGSEEAHQRTPHFAIKSGYQPNVPVGHAAFRDTNDGSPVKPKTRAETIHDRAMPTALAKTPPAPARTQLQPLNGVSQRDAISGGRVAEEGTLKPKPKNISPIAADALVSRLRAKPRAATTDTTAKPTPTQQEPESPESKSDAHRQPMPLLKPSGNVQDMRKHTDFVQPKKRIVSQQSLKRFEQSQTFDEILSFISILNDAVVGKKLRNTISESEVSADPVRRSGSQLTWRPGL